MAGAGERAVGKKDCHTSMRAWYWLLNIHTYIHMHTHTWVPIWTYVYIPHTHKCTHTHKKRWDDSPSNYATHPLSSCWGWQLTNCVTYVTLTKPRAVDKQVNPSLSLSWPPTLWLSDVVSLARCHQRGSCYCITYWEQGQDCLQETQEPKSVVPAPICTASAASTSPFRCLPSGFVYCLSICSL